ncbi:MAG: hypothetical protein ABFD91_04030 [Anaerohalosphaeraceae bacterium]
MIQSYPMKRFILIGGMVLSSCLCGAAQIEFSLTDSYGRQVKSQDYKGVPLFLEFGACW